MQILPNLWKTRMSRNVSGSYTSQMQFVGNILQELRFDSYIRKMWNDPRLAYSDGPEYIHFGYDTAKSFIWMPDLYFTKSTTTQITESFKRDAFVRIKSNGDIRVSLRWMSFWSQTKLSFSEIYSVRLLIHFEGYRGPKPLPPPPPPEGFCDGLLHLLLKLKNKKFGSETQVEFFTIVLSTGSIPNGDNLMFLLKLLKPLDANSGSKCPFDPIVKNSSAGAEGRCERRLCKKWLWRRRINCMFLVRFPLSSFWISLAWWIFFSYFIFDFQNCYDAALSNGSAQLSVRQANVPIQNQHLWVLCFLPLRFSCPLVLLESLFS